MSFPDPHWTWIAGGIIALVLFIAMMAWRRANHRHGGHRSRSGRSQGPGRDSGYGYGQEPGPRGGYGHGASQPGEQSALLQAVREVRSVLDKQVMQMGELRTFWSQRLDELDGKIGALVRAQQPGRGSEPERRPGLDQGGAAAPYDAGPYEGLRYESGWSPGPGDQPVEVRDGVLVVSRSLPPAGYLSAAGSGPARVYLNADVQLTEFSLPKWAAFFDLQGAKPYAAYRTRRPAEVTWDEAAGRGELVSKGQAEAI
jgi:hypothetical protein